MKALIKQQLGLAWLNGPGRLQLRGKSAVLMMHRVVGCAYEAGLPHNNPLCVDQNTFRDLLVWLQQYFELVHLEQALQPHRGRPRLALTFDDGWADNYSHAFPVLETLKVPASIFLTTGYIGRTRSFWWQAIAARLWQAPQTLNLERLLPVLAALNIQLPPELLDPAKTLERSYLILHFLEQLKGLAPQQLDLLAAEHFHQGQADAMDWTQIEQLEASGLVRFGPHGHHHYILTQLDAGDWQQDIRDSDTQLRAHCDRPLPVYCYPNGNHSPAMFELLQALGYSHALSTRSGLVSSRSAAYSLPRVDVSQQAARQPGLMAWRLLQAMRHGA